jgi:L-ascorbate metabolism protein UlaG (beta-lactamase superfamily)
MEFQYFGANCVKITSKKASVIIDDNLKSLGQKQVVTPKDIALYTLRSFGTASEARFIISSPGEYEASDISVQGIAARAHMDEPGTLTATMYRLIIDDVRIAAVGHIHPDLSDSQLEAMGTIDVLIVPIGGNGYTLDGIGAQKVIKEIEPKIIIPTHYDDPKLSYEVPQKDLETALKEIAMEPADRLDSLKLKNIDITEGTKLVVLNRKQI